jgi:hypothetical protein
MDLDDLGFLKRPGFGHTVHTSLCNQMEMEGRFTICNGQGNHEVGELRTTKIMEENLNTL